VSLFPAFNGSGVIPPFVGENPGQAGGSSPYKTDLATVANRLAANEERKTILKGLLRYRAALRAVGITAGFQLLDGSFTEDCENTRGRPPADLDLVTFAYLPVVPNEVLEFVAAHVELFDQAAVKAEYKCDAYFVDLAKDSRLVVEDTCYWYGLFSHQRETYLWKGMLKVALNADDALVSAMLEGEVVGG
jgi:hypothetical protein